MRHICNIAFPSSHPEIHHPSCWYRFVVVVLAKSFLVLDKYLLCLPIHVQQASVVRVPFKLPTTTAMTILATTMNTTMNPQLQL